MAQSVFSVVSQRFAEQLPLCLLGGTGVVILAWVLLGMTARQNPRTRFGIWFVALIAIGALLVPGGVHPIATSARALSVGKYAFFELPVKWAEYAFVAWLVCAFLALMRVGVGLWQVYRLRKSCVQIDEEGLDPALRACLQCRSSRGIPICVSDRVAMPTAIGFISPAVVMPTWLMKELSTADLKQVLLHELAHLQRSDDWTNLAQKVLRALLFFHPLVWWVESRLTLEREMACDDVVLSQTGNPHAYASCLASLAEKSFARRGIALAQAVVSRASQTFTRVSRIVHLKEPATSLRWTSFATQVALLGFVAIVLSHSPKIVQFEDATQPVLKSGTASGDFQQQERIAQKPVVSSVSAHSRRSGVVTASARSTPVRPTSVSPIDQSAETNPRLVMARETGEVKERASRADAMLVVMEGQQYGRRDVILWQVTVWRLTLPSDSPIRKESTPKKI